jgi:periplasmic protein TonB
MLRSAPTIRRSCLLVVLLAWPFVALSADEKNEPPVPIRTVAPQMPSSFIRSGSTSGLVTLSFLVDEKGVVQEAVVQKSSHPDLEEPALKAVKQWRFKPARKDGSPVSIRVSIPIKFAVE